jgi:hypothetical protein
MTHDDNVGGWGILAGSGVFLLYIGALVPGFLAVLLLTVALALPLLLPAVPLVVLGGLFVGLRKLVQAATNWADRAFPPRAKEYR